MNNLVRIVSQIGNSSNCQFLQSSIFLVFLRCLVTHFFVHSASGVKMLIEKSSWYEKTDQSSLAVTKMLEKLRLRSVSL